MQFNWSSWMRGDWESFLPWRRCGGGRGSWGAKTPMERNCWFFQKWVLSTWSTWWCFFFFGLLGEEVILPIGVICQDFSTIAFRRSICRNWAWLPFRRWVSTSPWRRERLWWTFELGGCGWPWKWRLQLVASFFAKMETVLKSFVSRIPTAQKAINVARRTSLSSAERSIGQGFLANKWINSCIEWWVFKSTNFSLSRSFWLMVARARWKFEGNLLIWENFSVLWAKNWSSLISKGMISTYLAGQKVGNHKVPKDTWVWLWF